MLPTTFWLALTYSCNDRCLGCYASSGCRVADSAMNNGTTRMEFGYACEVMDELRVCGAQNCLLIGGEPTLYSELEEVIRYGHSIGLTMKLVSNGRLLADPALVRRLKDAGMTHASVSIEASTADLHDRLTNSTGFGERLQGLRNLIDLGVSHNSILTITSKNCDEVVPVAVAMHEMGVRNILYNFCLPSVDGNGGVDGTYCLSPKACADLITRAYLELRERGIRFTFFGTIPLCLIEDDVRAQMLADKTIARSYHCHIFFGTGAAFEPNGNVLPCTHFVNTPLFNARGLDGHFTYKGRFAHEWEEGVHHAFVEDAWKYPAERCTTCDLWGVCVGGCPFQWMYFDPIETIGRKEEA